MKLRMPSLAMLKTMKQLLQSLKLQRRRSRRLRKCSILKPNADLKKRQDLLKKSTDTINGLFDSINANMATMSITIPEDKKKTLTKEIAAVKDKLEVNGRFASTVKKIEDLVADLTAFDNSLKAIDSWKDAATAGLKDIKEDIAAKLEILKQCAA